MKKKCILLYNKVLMVLMALLGMVSCGIFRKPQPCMYAVPYNDFKDTIQRTPEVKDSVATDTTGRRFRREFKAMYGVSPARYQPMQKVEKEGLDIEIRQ